MHEISQKIETDIRTNLLRTINEYYKLDDEKAFKIIKSCQQKSNTI